MSISNQMIFLSYVPKIKLSPLGCTEILDIHLAPDAYLETTLYFYRLYWKTVWWVATKKCGLVGWKVIDCTIPFVWVNGLWDDALAREWIRTYDVD
jgi:hypothetical protein